METESMRSAWLKKLFVFTAFCLCMTAQAQVNPHTQIRWPANCNNPNMLYNWQNNTCINAVVGPKVDPATQMNWPATCATDQYHVYNSQINSCISTYVTMAAGTTTTLPAGAPATLTVTGTYPTYVLSFGIPTGTPGGSLSYPGVVTDNNNGLNISGGQSMGSPSTPATNYFTGDSAPKHPGTSNSADYYSIICTNTINSYFNGAGSTGLGGTHHYCMDMAGMRWSAPGIDLGTTSSQFGWGAQGWSVQTGIYLPVIANSPGISGAFSIGQTKAGIGDNIASYMYETNYGGAVAGADEGLYALGLAASEAGTVYTGKIVTSTGTGSTSLTVNCAPGTGTDCAFPGDGRYLIDTNNGVISGNVTAKGAPSGFTPGTYTTDVAVTPSTFWCTVADNPGINTPQPTNPALAGVQATSMTWTCNSGPGNTGTPAVNNQICFAGQYHEQSTIDAVSGAGPWTITAKLRHTHERLSWVVAGGPCGTFIEIVANTVPPANGTLPAQTLRYPVDILGAPDAHTLWWRQFTLTGANSNLPTNLHLADTIGGTISNTGGTVTMTAATVTNGNYQFTSYFSQPTITISGTGTAFDGPCTNTAPNASGQLTCTQAASTGVGPVTGATIGIGTSQYGNAAFNLYHGAETLDVQTYTTTPPSVSPNNVTTFALEPNNAAWVAGTDTVEQSHHYALQARLSRETEVVYNPMIFTTNIHQIAASGSGIRGGALTTPANNFSMYYISNGQPATYYNYHGGLVMPPGGVYVEGLMNYGLGMHYAPDPIGMPAIYIGCPYSGCTDPNFNYSVFSLANPAGVNPVNTSNLLFTPNTKTFAWQNGFMDFLSMPIYRPTIQSVANGQPATLKLNAIDSGGVSHATTIAAPLTGAGGFTATLPILAANASLAISPSGTQAWGLNVLVAGTVTVSNAAACTPNGTTCTYTLTRCNANSSTGIGSLSVGTVVPGNSFIINALSPTNTVLTTDLSSACWRIN
jgi:hypothetical protein